MVDPFTIHILQAITSVSFVGLFGSILCEYIWKKF